MNRCGLLLLLLLAACAGMPGRPATIPPLSETVELDTASAISARSPFNVSIRVFSSRQEAGRTLHGSQARVRSVEKRYLPYQLKQTLDRSGFWGAVRVLPQDDSGAEIIVEGTILASDGLKLKLLIAVRDAGGKVWIDREYEDFTTEIDYATDPLYALDPFQDIYNRIANDMSEGLAAINDEDHARLVDIATIKYAQLLSPESFGGYVERTKSGTFLVGLPAKDDPLLARVEKIRSSEYLFADSVDAHYESLYRRLGPTYAWWRHYSFELRRGNERLESRGVTRGARRGSWYAVERIYKTYKDSKMNEDALRELTISFDRETASTVTEVAGRMVELKGTLENQYEEWRRILREFYRFETGL